MVLRRSSITTMHRAVGLLLLSFGLGLASAADARAACAAPTASSGPQIIDVDGVRRSLLVRIPAAKTTPAPVVFAFHPFGMNANYMQSRAPVARAWPEAIVVYPDAAAPSRAWQGGVDGEDNRDLRFFDAMLSWLDTHGCIDRSRVFALGYSNGGQFTHRLACERDEQLAGIAVAAGRLTCTPRRAMPVIVSHGLADTTAPYPLAVQATTSWSQQNACKAPPASGVAGCSAATGCGDAASVLCTYPGGHDYDPPFTARAVEFFKAVPVVQ
jgi:polyhydroxybutyrate depolymerase